MSKNIVHFFYNISFFIMLLTSKPIKNIFILSKALYMTLLNNLKTIILLAFVLYIAPFVIENIKKQYILLLEPHVAIGVIHITEPIHNAQVLTTQLYNFFQNSTIKGIVIKIN